MDLVMDMEVYLENHGFDHSTTLQIVPKLKTLGMHKPRDLGKLTRDNVTSIILSLENQEKLLKLRNHINDQALKEHNWETSRTYKDRYDQDSRTRTNNK